MLSLLLALLVCKCRFAFWEASGTPPLSNPRRLQQQGLGFAPGRRLRLLRRHRGDGALAQGVQEPTVRGGGRDQVHRQDLHTSTRGFSMLYLVSGFVWRLDCLVYLIVWRLDRLVYLIFWRLVVWFTCFCGVFIVWFT